MKNFALIIALFAACAVPALASEASVINEQCRDPVETISVYPVIDNFETMTNILDNWAQWTTDDLELAKKQENITILSTSSFDKDIVKIHFMLNGKKGLTYLRGRPYGMTTNGALKQPDFGHSNSKAVLIIPGTGHNQSVRMMANEPNVPGTMNYQNILFKIGTAVGDAFVYQYPGQGLRSLVCTNLPVAKKLIPGEIENYLLIKGTSTATVTLVELLVTMKWLRTANSVNKKWVSYNVIGVLGLSKGAFSALMTAIYSQPTAAVIASGFSLKEYRSIGLGMGSNNIPNFQTIWPQHELEKAIKNSPTKFYYSVSSAKPELAIMLEESETDETAKALAGPNFTYNKHTQGHKYPFPDTKNWLLNVMKQD